MLRISNFLHAALFLTLLLTASGCAITSRGGAFKESRARAVTARANLDLKRYLLSRRAVSGQSQLQARNSSFAAYGKFPQFDTLAKQRRFPNVIAHPLVQKQVQYYQTDGRATVVAGLERLEQHGGLIEGIIASKWLPREVLGVPFAESVFKSGVESPAGAVGMWQFMEGTAEDYGLEVCSFRDERADVEKSTYAAVMYLSDLFDTFGDWLLALAAYNAGPERVKGAIRRTGSADFFELARAGELPKETAKYVPKVVALATISAHPEKFGFSKSKSDRLQFAKNVIFR